MTWDYPIGLIAAILLPLIVLLHLLSRRRRTLTVPSLHLWNRLLENEKRSMRLRRLIADALLFLQLTAASLAVIAMAGPRTTGQSGRISGPTVLALDLSAGMAAPVHSDQPDGPTRLDAAVDEAMALVRSKALGSEVAILTGASGVRLLSDFTDSRSRLLESLRGIEPTDEPGTPRRLLRAASALASSRAGSRVFFLTDGAFDDGPPATSVMEAVLVGNSADNTGITLFAVRSQPGGGREMLLGAGNFGSRPQERRLSVRLDDRILLEDDVLLLPGEQITRSLSWQDDVSGWLSATFEGDVGDALPADDSVRAYLVSGPRLRVLLYTPGNWFLETLLAAHPSVNLEVRRGKDEAVRPADPADLVIADRIGPPSDAGSALLAVYPFDGASPPLPLRPAGVSYDSDPVSWDTAHPVMRDVEFDRVSVRRSTVLDIGPGVDVLAESAAGPLLTAGEDGGRRWAALSFDLLESSLPVNPAFPILVANLMDWMLPGTPDSAVEMLQAGEEWLRPPALDSGVAWEVSGPDGVHVSPGYSGIAPHRTGTWTAWEDGHRRDIGVNLLSAQESDVNPRWMPAPDAQDRGQSTRAGERLSGSANGPVESAGSRPLTSLLLLASLAAMLAEWAVQARVWRHR